MEADPVDLSEEYRALLRRDWAVRVLDAWCRAEDGCLYSVSDSGEMYGASRSWRCSVEGIETKAEPQRFFGNAPDEVRLAAAKAVYTTLPDTVRAQLGEAP